MLDHVAPALALEDIGNLLEHLSSGFAAIEILVPERDAEADNRRRRIVDVLVELLGPQPHLGAAIRVARGKARIGKGLLEIFEDDVRFRYHLIAVDQGRHHRPAVELEVPGLLVLAGAQHQVPALPFEPLLGEADPRLLRAERHVIVVEREHGVFLSIVTSSIIHASAIGVHSTCSMRVAPVASITRRSKPSAIPLACGIAASACRKSSSSG